MSSGSQASGPMEAAGTGAMTVAPFTGPFAPFVAGGGLVLDVLGSILSGGGKSGAAPVATGGQPKPVGGSLQAPIVGHSTALQGPLNGMGSIGQTSPEVQQMLQNMMRSGSFIG